MRSKPAPTEDTGAIDIAYSDRLEISVLCNRIEETLDLSTPMESKFIWLLYNEQKTLVELYLSGELESYLEWYDKSYREQESNVRKSLEQHCDPATARALAREFIRTTHITWVVLAYLYQFESCCESSLYVLLSRSICLLSCIILNMLPYALIF